MGEVRRGAGESRGLARDAGDQTVTETRGVGVSVMSIGLGGAGPERLHLIGTRYPQRQRLQEPKRRKDMQTSVCFF